MSPFEFAVVAFVGVAGFISLLTLIVALAGAVWRVREEAREDPLERLYRLPSVGGRS